MPVTKLSAEFPKTTLQSIHAPSRDLPFRGPFEVLDQGRRKTQPDLRTGLPFLLPKRYQENLMSGSLTDLRENTIITIEVDNAG